jgi:hypothetical protein
MIKTSSETFASEIASARRLVTSRRAELGILEGDLGRRSGEHDSLKAKSVELGDAITLVQNFAGGIQSGVVSRFGDLVTDAVREIYGRDYTVTIDFQAKGNSVWADFVVQLPDGKKVSLTEGEGGGLRDLVAVLCRILYLVLDPTVPARFMVLDESLKALDVWRSPHAFSVITKVAKDVGIQAIWVSHSAAVLSDGGSIGMDKVYRFSNPDGITIVEAARPGMEEHEIGYSRQQGLPEAASSEAARS